MKNKIIFYIKKAWAPTVVVTAIFLIEYFFFGMGNTMIAPFAALTGHEEAISETARLTDEKAALGEDVMERLDWIFMQIKAKMSENPEVTITYFLPDEKKAGGRYESYAGVVKKMDEYKRELVFNDHTVIPMHQIVNIEADWLERSSNEDITCD